MTVIVKICGLREPRTLEAALDAGADMVGFVSFEASPRHVGLGDARSLGRRVGRRARKVLLVVDADDRTLADAVDALEPDIIQLHGRETAERVQLIRDRYGLPIIKAWAVASSGDLHHAKDIEPSCDYMLFDARAPAGATRPGGNAISFDWSLLRDHSAERPWLLAGGLHAGNVGVALRASGAGGVDVSSGVESAPGVKDTQMIRHFVSAAQSGRQADGSGFSKADEI